MSEKALRIIFIFGTLFFFVVLGVLSVDSLTQVLTTRTPALTSDVTAGKGLWENRNCNDCHTILGIGGYFAPELTKVAIRRDPTWISNFLLDPLATKPGTTMPNQKLTAIQANQLVSFFQWVALVDTNGWPPQPKLALGGASAGAAEIMEPAQEGELLFTLKGCNACHMVNGLGAIGPGPDLSLIGSTPYGSLPNDAGFLALWLKDPVAQKPDTTMPRLGLTDAEIEALVAYLTSLK